MSLRNSLAEQVRAGFGGSPPKHIGVALSGGGDSVALLHLLKCAFDPGEVTLHAATVDHGLRPESAAEAVEASVLAARLGVSHQILSWEGWNGKGNLQDQARQARYRLLTAWAKARGLPALALGHTADDQAETLLMRLGRSAGVSGLSAMPARRIREGLTLVRPLLGVQRADLRRYLEAEGVSWNEDPSNEDMRFERIRFRKAMEVLEPLGLTVDALAAVAANMGQAREALDWFTFLAWQDQVRLEAGAVVISHGKFRVQPAEISYRLLQHALMRTSGAAYPPRRAPMLDLLAKLRSGRGGTLSGCRIFCRGGRIWICREYNAVKGLSCATGQLWDKRWRMTGPDGGNLAVRALGPEGLQVFPEWRETGLPRPVLEATPALWNGKELAAAPLAGLPNGWSAEAEQGEEDFFASVLSH